VSENEYPEFTEDQARRISEKAGLLCEEIGEFLTDPERLLNMGDNNMMRAEVMCQALGAAAAVALTSGACCRKHFRENAARLAAGVLRYGDLMLTLRGEPPAKDLATVVISHESYAAEDDPDAPSKMTH